MSTAINIYLKKLERERRIPFEVVADPFYSSENIAILDKRIADKFINPTFAIASSCEDNCLKA